MFSCKKVLVIGSGGREHALCWKLSLSPNVEAVYCAPGSVGISMTPKCVCVDVDLKNFRAVAEWCTTEEIDLVVVGPEDPLANGIADVLQENKIPCFGPPKAGARIESDKDWAKQFMTKYNIPTARFQSFNDTDSAKKFINSADFPALVVKASGLAAGKGVIVAANKEEACSAVDEISNKFGQASETIVIEELLEGEEVSVLAFTDGDSVRVMLPAQDHKRLGDGDTGPNTGGMGAYCPCPLISKETLAIIEETVIRRAVEGLKKEGIRYVGVLYAGMMLTKSGPMTLEFNCRFGDPETQVILPLLESDLSVVMKACTEGQLCNVQLAWKSGVTAVGVVLASKGYPETSTKGCVISGLSQVSQTEGLMVFHSGVSRGPNGSLVTWGGRVLLVCALAEGPREAAAKATAAAGIINFPGQKYRKDIAKKAFTKIGPLSYLSSGVDIEAAALLVRALEPVARETHRAGVLGRLGCFGGLFHLDKIRPALEDPVLVLGTDGVGTKVKIAESLQRYDTIGIDLVAMCVNDILCAGAEPFAFLDYLACGHLDVSVASEIIKGIASACKQSGCALLGGETAEMPYMYDAGKYDLAGFAVGVVDHDKQLPRVDSIQPGDIVLGLPSSGVHSNGYSLVQKILNECGQRLEDVVPFSVDGRTFGEELLTPTALYIKPLLEVVKKDLVKGLAHITGGGLLENIPRILSSNIRVQLDATKFKIKPIFGWLQAKGGVSDFEMLRTFNCGVGMVAIIDPKDVEEVIGLIDGEVDVIGVVQHLETHGGHQVVVDNFPAAMERLVAPYRTDVAVVSKSLSYKDSGVDIEAGDSLVSLIKPLARSTSRAGVLGGLGGFGGSFHLKSLDNEYKDPVLVMAAAGVGTKLKVAQKMNWHSTVGIDLVAMCANDILSNGAEPLTFLDYFACGSLDVKTAREVVAGIAEGCRQSTSALIGGETAEMPGMYEPGVYDLAGFSLGVVERSKILPRTQDILVGDILIGLPSNGLHSNGFSLIHQLMKKLNLTLQDKAPFSKEGLLLGEELLKPTRIYVKSVLPAIHRCKIKAIAHIKGGGIMENLPRVMPDNVKARLNAHWWSIHPVFAWIADAGDVTPDEMLKTFNCGLGMILIVAPEDQAEVMNTCRSWGAMVVGSIQARKANLPRVIVDNFDSAISFTRRMRFIPHKKVAVLVSGNGSNLQALIDSTRDKSDDSMFCDIELVISNKENAFALKRAEKAGIPTYVLDHKKYASREEFDREITAVLEAHKIDIVCLAGFMRILSAEFVLRWKGRLINIHPSLLPAWPGVNAQKQAFEAGVKETGCTVHFVDEGVDTGAILVQEKVSVANDDTLESLTSRILEAEHRAYTRALRLIASGRVRLAHDNKVIWYA